MFCHMIYLEVTVVDEWQDSGVTIFLYWTPYLADVMQEAKGRVFKWDNIQQGNARRGMDMLIQHMALVDTYRKISTMRNILPPLSILEILTLYGFSIERTE